jgi:polyphosphate kinase
MSEDTAADGATDESEGADGDGVDAEVDLSDPRYYLNRELSELAFQKRVLHEAIDARNPLLERVKFLGILTQNLDEFVMKRIGGLKQQLAADVTELSPDGMTPREQWEATLADCGDILAMQSALYRDVLRPEMAAAGIEILDHDDLTAEEQGALGEYFEESVLPTLTPLSFDPAHPFPHLSNLSLSLGVFTEQDDERKFSRVKIPQNRPRLVALDDVTDTGDDGRDRYVPLERVVAANLDRLFPNVEVLDWATFRVTRNAEVRRNEAVAEDLIEMIESVLRERQFAAVVRLDVAEDMPPAMRDLLMEHLDVTEREVFDRPEPLDFRPWMDLADLDRPEHTVDPWTPQPHPRFVDADPERPASLFEEIARGDVLVHHPYHSFEETVQRFLAAAAEDPDVLAIKAAIYRTAHDSEVVETLIEAARNGKQVAVMVELKARFDEKNNLRWARRLEEEGIHVAYGTIGLKTHTKTALVVREEEEEGVRLYSHVGTGNYHSETAKTYVDLGLLTADRNVGQDLVRVFNFFTGHSMHEEYRDLLVAPTNMRERFRELIEREAEHARSGESAGIVAKVNRLEDPDLVAALYRASMAGVDIDLVVRDICRLRPGLPGVSDTVDVYSVVGRFLEHSRVFRFENAGDPAFYLGSADWMTRNLDRRVEAVAPVEDETLQDELQAILDVMLADNRRRWEMNADGGYHQHRPGEEPTRSTHEVLMEQAIAAAREAQHEAGHRERTHPGERPERVFDPEDLV